MGLINRIFSTTDLRRPIPSVAAMRFGSASLELPIKVVQARLGHASIQMTADRYGQPVPAR
jgi:integrase